MTTRIVRIEQGMLTGERPRHAGSNARLGDHGQQVAAPLVRLTDSDGASGFGFCRAGQETLAPLLGAPLDSLFDPAQGAIGDGLACDFPLWDLVASRAGQPVYALAAAVNGRPAPDGPVSVPCYDTSLYFDDLHLASDEEAAALIASEAREGYARGHRAFKVKVGRGARHLPPEEGTARDIAVIRAVREAVGDGPDLLLDANNGYTLNLARRVLGAVAACRPRWLEEAFHEDPILYRELRDWLRAEQMPTLIADGEGDASSHLLDWARDGLIDVVQYDIFAHGFTRWLATGRQLDAWGVRAAPHHYGRLYGNYVAGHLAPAIAGFTFVEWDEATTPVLDTSAYRLGEGQVLLSTLPGFGLRLDDARFRAAVTTTGFTLTC